MVTDYNFNRRCQMVDKRAYSTVKRTGKGGMQELSVQVKCKFCDDVGYPFCSEICQERYKRIHGENNDQVKD